VQQESAGVGLAIAFSAGLLSFLSPCVLPLIPSYVTFITGLSFEDVTKSRRTALIHSLLFILGFTLIFLALGAVATGFGRMLLANRFWLSRIGGTLVIVFGLYLLGVLNIGFLAQERRVHLHDKPLGYLGTVVVGIAFGAGWSPCIGPILGAILTYTASQADLSRGLLLLLAYSMGLAIPFLAAALAVERFLAIFAKMRSQMVWVQRIAGVLLIFVGVLMVTNYLSILSNWMSAFTPEFIKARL
jgi:cytochrome c-type biogenesis protein